MTSVSYIKLKAKICIYIFLCTIDDNIYSAMNKNMIYVTIFASVFVF